MHVLCVIKGGLFVDIGHIINKYGEKYSPYRSGLVNHLPMAQLAMYKMTENMKKVEALTKDQTEKGKIDQVREEYPECESLDTCIGNRDMYESVLDIFKRDINEDNIDDYLKKILNENLLCMSSGLFHTLIRVYYGVEGYRMDKNLIQEVRRALAYYLTACREGDVFQRKIAPDQAMEEMEKLIEDENIQAIIGQESTTGMKMKSLYESPHYMEAGFIIDGNKDEKVEALLSFLLPAFINTGSIVVLHGITGLQALLGLEEYYEDFHQALDIYTSMVITHILTVIDLGLDIKPKDKVDFSWEYILSLGSGSHNSHHLKFTYSCHELSKKYPVRNLKRAVLKRIDII